MKPTTLLLLLFPILLFSQKKLSTSFGKGSLSELKMKFYEKDSTASAVVLFEHANRYPDLANNETPRIDYYYRVKIFNKNAYDLANVVVYLRNKEQFLDFKATTYNLTEKGTITKTKLSNKDIFTVDENKNWKSKKFSLPNIKDGSVIEYKYSILSPYLSIDDWKFQSNIPKIKSQYNAAILGNYNYNVRVVGNVKLDVNEAKILKDCVFIDGIGSGNCVSYNFAINNIPAFKEEDYMLSKKNYLFRLVFDLKSTTSYNGSIKKYTTTWNKADKSLKELFFNNQTSKKNFFKRQLSEEILNISDNYKKAKAIYQYIQEHYTWNKKYWTNEDAKVKKAFNDKSGDVGEINLSLYNSLRAGGINANLVVLSTRNNGIPTKLYPIIFDYNYVIVTIKIDNKVYYLDATDKFLPFGEIPTRVLNGEARVIDFKNDGYFVVLKPKFESSKYTYANLKLDESGEFSGNLTIRRTGYFARNQREKLKTQSEDSYLEEFESDYTDLEIESYKVEQKDSLNKRLTESFKVVISMEEALANKSRINPFLFSRMKTNPFKLKERNYPVDFAYPRKNNFQLKLKIPTNYKVVQKPKNVAISLPNRGGRFILKTSLQGNTLNIYSRMSINKKIYSANEYHYLKEFFNQIIKAEEAYLILEKI